VEIVAQGFKNRGKTRYDKETSSTQPPTNNCESLLGNEKRKKNSGRRGENLPHDEKPSRRPQETVHSKMGRGARKLLAMPPKGRATCRAKKGFQSEERCENHSLGRGSALGQIIPTKHRRSDAKAALRRSPRGYDRGLCREGPARS